MQKRRSHLLPGLPRLFGTVPFPPDGGGGPTSDAAVPSSQGAAAFFLPLHSHAGRKAGNGGSMRISMISAAVVAALVGYGASVAIVLAAAAALGATPAQTASWLFAVCIAKAAGSAGLSWWHRVPVVLAWSTPGAALIATTSGFSMAEGVGAFVVASALIALTGLFQPLGRLVAMIPDAVAGAMLAGVLLPFCLKGAATLQDLSAVVMAMVAIFALVRLWNPAFAVIAALGAGIVFALLTGAAIWPEVRLAAPMPVIVAPTFDLGALLGLALPLYLVTMAGQNLPGFATLRAAGYVPPVRSALVVTGGLSGMAALFGAHPVNMAAITAAICLGDDVHPDRDQRWMVGVVYGAAWVGLGLLGPAVITVLTALPAPLSNAVVALALLGPLMGALATAYGVPDQRFAATMTFVVAGSGVAAFGIGGAFWGLLAGLVIYGLDRARLALFPKAR
jgi:benzoate membrane transport protein